MNFFPLLLALSLTPALAADYTITRQYVYPTVVSQTSTTPGFETIISSGSAVAVAPGYAVTAAHVIPESQNNTIYVFNGTRQLRAKPVKIDKARDLALLSVDVKCPCAPIAEVGPAIDEPVVAVGFPLYTTYRIQLATVGSTQGMYQGNLVTTTTTAPGGSGGGLFVKNNNQYELAGITVAIASAPLGPRVMNLEQEYNWLTFSVPVSTIRNFLRNTPAAPK